MKMNVKLVLAMVVGCGLLTANANAGLVAHYKLDETSGLSAADSAAGPLNGTLTGDTNGGNGNGTFDSPSWVAGVSGGAARFGDDYHSSSPDPKADDVIQVGSKGGGSNPDPGKSGVGTKFDITGALTISAWVNLSADFADGITSTRHIAGKDHSNGATDDGYGLQHRMSSSDDVIRFIMAKDDTDTYIQSTATLSAMKAASTNNGWVHLVGVYEPSTSMKLYIDGVLDAGATLTVGVPDQIQSTPTEFTIGRLGGDNPSAWKYAFYGDIDDVQLYNEALGASDVSYLFNNPGTAVPEPSTIALLLCSLGAFAFIRKRK